MSDTQFQQQVLVELQKLNGRFDTLEGKFDTLEGKFDTLEGKVDALATEFHEFKMDQEQFNQNLEQKTDALWSLSNQAFSAITDLQRKSDTTQKYIDDIHQETISPWKRRQSKSLM